MKTKTQNKTSIKIFISEIMGFGSIIILVWMNEIFDIPHIFFNAPATPINLEESIIESIGIIILGIITILHIYRILKKLKYISGFYHLCAQCKKIKFEDAWIPLDEFMLKHNEVKISHGLCPECYKKAEEEL